MKENEGWLFEVVLLFICKGEMLSPLIWPFSGNCVGFVISSIILQLF